MKRTWRNGLVGSAETLSAPGNGTAIDISSFDGFVVKVVTASVDANVVFYLHTDLVGDGSWGNKLTHDNQGTASGQSIGTGGTVTDSTDTTHYYAFSRNDVGMGYLNHARKIRLVFHTESASPSAATVTWSVASAYTNR